jgi:hypothetical protein
VLATNLADKTHVHVYGQLVSPHHRNTTKLCSTHITRFSLHQKKETKLDKLFRQQNREYGNACLAELIVHFLLGKFN